MCAVSGSCVGLPPFSSAVRIDVGRHRRAPEDLVADRVGDRVQDRAVGRRRPAARRCRARRPASPDPAGSTRRPLHLLRRVENRRRLVVVEPLRQRRRRSAGRRPTSGRSRGRCRASIRRASGRRGCADGSPCRRRRPPGSRGSWYLPVSTSTSTSAKPATKDCDWPSRG